MRRALLFMILINSITCVTHNLAMEEEMEENTPGLKLEIDDENKLSDSKDKLPQKLTKSIMLKVCGLTSITLLFMGATPAVSSTLGARSISGIDGMVKTASPITIHTGFNITEKPGCTYEQWQRR